MNKKYLIIVAVAVVLIGLGSYSLVKYAKAPTQEDGLVKPATTTIDTTDWLTYNNKENGFEIKYPPKAVLLTNITGSADRGAGVSDIISVPEQLKKEREEIQGKGTGLGVGINIDNPTTKYTSPCVWYYAERENIFVEETDQICARTEPTPDVLTGGYSTTFAGEPAYVRIINTDGTQGGLFAVKGYDIVFFRNGRPWEVQYGTTPDHPSDKWKSHPYYPYLEKSVPVSEAIINSFKFTETPAISSATSSISAFDVYKVWGSDDDQLNRTGYLPRTLQYGDKTILIENEPNIQVEFGQAKLVHYDKNLIRTYGWDEQLEGRGAPMIGHVVVELKAGEGNWSQCVVGDIGEGIHDENGYDIYLYDNKIITLTKSYVSSMGRIVGINICESASSTKSIILRSQDRDGVVSANIEEEIKKIYAVDDNFSLWLKNALLNALNSINKNVVAPAG